MVNAVVHRNYSITGAQIRLLLFTDRCEFISPGKLPNTVRIEKLAVGTSFARNPLLVRFAFPLELIIPRIPFMASAPMHTVDRKSVLNNIEA